MYACNIRFNSFLCLLHDGASVNQLAESAKKLAFLALKNQKKKKNHDYNYGYKKKKEKLT